MNALLYRYFAALALLLAVASWRTSAQSSNSLRVAQIKTAGNGLQLQWTNSSSTGLAYTVQFQDTLTDGIWRLPASAQPWPTPLTGWTDAPTAGNASRFYRVLAVPAAQRGKIISATLASSLTTFQMAFLFNAAGIPITPQYPVQLYKVVYETITPWGARTTASGALAVPLGFPGPLPLVSYQHGTLTLTNSAPSSMDLTGEVTVGVAFATTGYAAVVPDYLGLGASPGLHPYHHARSEATACVDLLRAAKLFCPTNGFPLNAKLFLCGYSQGGHATMALLRELETFHTNEFTVTACAPMAGAYDLSGTTTDYFLSGAAEPNPYYFAYLLAAYEDVYHLAPSLADVLQSPYNTTLPPLLHGNTSGSQINAAMPADPTQIFAPAYLTAFKTNPRHPLRLALRENDLYAWTPRAPLRLYHCAADRDVPYTNSVVALNSFQSRGATQVQLIDPVPTADHGGCALPSLTLAKAWFDSLR